MRTDPLTASNLENDDSYVLKKSQENILFILPILLELIEDVGQP